MNDLSRVTLFPEKAGMRCCISIMRSLEKKMKKENEHSLFDQL